jgi:methionine sulfoxide reductase heme-binding subunit
VRDFLRKILTSKWSKVVAFFVCLSPFVYLAWPLVAFLAWRVEPTRFGANPVEYVQHFTGDWTLRLLLITLSITPLRKVLNLPDLIRFRRLLGLFAFFYVCLHFLTYIWPDQNFDLHGMWKDVAKRPFVTVGFLGFVLLIPLAITSTKGWIRRLGGKRWQNLHRLIYVSGLCGVLHYYWLVKSNHRMPLFYATILAVLLLYRLGTSLLKPHIAPPAKAAAPSSSSSGYDLH